MLKLYWKYFRITIVGLIVSCLTVIIAPSFDSYSLEFNYLSHSITPSSSIILAQSSKKSEESLTEEDGEKTTEEAEKDSVEVQEADVLVDGKAIFTIKTSLGELSPESRAKTAMSNLEDVAQNNAITPEQIRIVNLKELGLVQADDTIIITFAEEDAEAESLTFSEFLNKRREEIENAIIDYRKARTKTSISQGIGKAIIATIIAILSLYLLKKVLPSIFDRLRAWQRERLDSVEFQGLQFISGRQVAQFISFLFTVTRIFLVFLVFYIYLPLVLSYFPWTQPIGIKLLSNFWDSINLVISGILSYIPNLFIIAVIGLIAYYSIRFARIFFNAIGEERIRINGFYPEWSEPTYNLIMFFIIGLSGILIFPYLPASNSAGFQGISIFAGALFTLGSTAIVGNIVSNCSPQ